jgi:hypothetical protein
MSFIRPQFLLGVSDLIQCSSVRFGLSLILSPLGSDPVMTWMPFLVRTHINESDIVGLFLG